MDEGHQIPRMGGHSEGLWGRNVCGSVTLLEEGHHPEDAIRFPTYADIADTTDTPDGHGSTAYYRRKLTPYLIPAHPNTA